MHKESGFTLVELLAALALAAVLMGLGAFALRQFWIVRSLYGGRDQVVTELRALQERTVAEAHPIVFGMRFPKGGGEQSTVGVIRYNGRVSPPICTEQRKIVLDAGTRVRFNGTDFAELPATDPIRVNCKEQLRKDGTIKNVQNDEFVFFFGRGTATPGQVAFENPALEGRQAGLTVAGPTGRIEAQ